MVKRKNLGIASARAGNVVGGGDMSKDRLIPDTIKNLLKNKTVVIRNPKANRPWQHVLEPLWLFDFSKKSLFKRKILLEALILGRPSSILNVKKL